MIFQASRFLPQPTRFHQGGGLRVVRGRVAAVYATPGAVRRASRASGERPIDLGEGLLVPGLVNAHAHLELSGLAGGLPSKRGFVSWIRALVARRGELSLADHERAVRDGARRLLAAGTTTVGDVDSTGAGKAASRVGLRTLVYREVLDAWDPSRTSRALARIRGRLPERRLLTEGLSPHAPYTTSRELLARVAVLARKRKLPVTVHWAETDEEERWLVGGTGPFRGILSSFPGESGLDLLDRAGLLRARTSLVHGNHPSRGDPRRLAEAGVALVHCPGTHSFFDRPVFPWQRFRRAGVTLALGTDSLASNAELDMRREAALARETLPGLSPERAWRMVTTDAARALALAGRVGELRRGAEADFVLFDLVPETRREALDALTARRGRVRDVWVAGRSVSVG